MKTKEQCIEIAARIWCDQELRQEVLQPKLVLAIAEMLHKGLNSRACTSNPWLSRNVIVKE